MTDQPENKAPALLENPFAPDLFAGAAISFGILAGSCISVVLTAPRWNTTENRFDHPVVARLVMPIAGAQGLANGLFAFLKSQGFDPAAPSPGESVQ